MQLEHRNGRKSGCRTVTRAGTTGCLRDKSPKRAIGFLRDALISDPDFAEPHLEIAKIFHHYIPTRLDLAACALNLYLAAVPDSVDGHYYRGAVESKLGNSENSEVSFRKAIDLDRFDVRALVGLATELLKRGEVTAALPLLEQAVEWCEVQKRSGEAAIRLCLADAYERTGNIAPAIQQWKAVIDLPEVWPEQEGNRKTARRKLAKFEVSE